MKLFVIILSALLLAGCAGKVSYVRPTAMPTPGANTVTIQKSRDAVWASAVPELGKRFFVINNLDKASGLINISYAGSPERYIDCGRVNSYVKNAQGERTYDFAGSSPQQRYEIMDPGNGLFVVDRKMNLEGRVNLIFEEMGPAQTRVTANTKYVVRKNTSIRRIDVNIPNTMDDTISFNSGSSDRFPNVGASAGTECVATGTLEREILEAIR